MPLIRIDAIEDRSKDRPRCPHSEIPACFRAR